MSAHEGKPLSQKSTHAQYATGSKKSLTSPSLLSGPHSNRYWDNILSLLDNITLIVVQSVR